MDFTLKTYRNLLKILQNQGFSFLTFKDYVTNSGDKVIILRYDVDRLPGNSLIFAKIQNELGIKGTYYFRIVSESFDKNIIEEIHSLGHEVGYHYEDLSFAWAKLKAQGIGRRAQGVKQKGAKVQRHNGSTEKEVGSKKYVVGSKKYEVGSKEYNEEEYERYLVGIAIESFRENLEKLRKIVPVKTICMHGSPMSRWDSRLLWKYYDYHDFGIIGEPYFDVNFEEVLYLTDTGRRWDGESFNIRDKATGCPDKSGSSLRYDRQLAEGRNGATAQWHSVAKDDSELRVQGIGNWHKARGTGYEENRAPHTTHHEPFPRFHKTFDIIRAAEEGKLPDKIMITFHPQRWTDKPVPWVHELVWQNVKNVGKYIINKMKG